MDILERLRTLAEALHGFDADVCNEAADEIERLRWRSAAYEDQIARLNAVYEQMRDRLNDIRDLASDVAHP